jgi:anaerobic selenocysteine-containing dehydrogenase
MNLFNSPYRVHTPVRRVGERGAGGWEPVSWDRALSDLGETLERNLAAGKREGVALSVPQRRVSPFLRRFVSFFPVGCLEAADGYELQVERNAHRGMPGHGCDGMADLENAEVVLNFGANPLGSIRFLPGAARGWAQGTRQGARWITLDPRLSETAAASQHWIPLRPGTDGVFTAAMAGLILRSDRGRSFLKGLPAGEQARLRDLLGPWSPERAARVCGVSAGTIRDVAETFAEARSAVAIFGSGITARENGLRDARGVLLLNFLTGNVNRKGGYRLFDDRPWKQPAPAPSHPNGPTLPGTLFREIALGRRPVDTLITWEANPAATDPEVNGTVAVLKNRKRVPYHVALSTVWNETALLADLVLPASTYLEEWGLIRGISPTDGSGWVGLRQPVFRPVGDARSGESVLLAGVRQLGERGRNAFPFSDMEHFYRMVFSANVPTSEKVSGFDLLRRQGVRLLPGRPGEGPGVSWDAFHWEKSFPAAGGVSPLVPKEAVLGTGRAAGGCEKTLLLYGSPMQGPDSLRLKWVEEIEHNRPLWMHPAVAGEIGCSEGDWVEVQGPAGEIRTRVRLTEGLHPEAVAMRAAGVGMSGLGGLSGTGGGTDPDRVWWGDETYGENVRKVIPWPADPGRTSPGWDDTRVTVRKAGGQA